MIDLRDVTVSLGGTSVLDGVSTSVGEGSFVGLVGPNGAGKTTLLRTINGYLSPDGGHVRVDGDEVGPLPTREVARRVATVPQETSLGFDFDVRSVVEMGRHACRPRLAAADDREQVRAALERAEVAALADRSVSEISGGERQRVLIARALAQDAPVLLLDEPTASLDIHHQVRTLALARDLAREGRTVLAAIHDLDLAARYCDELRLLAGGRLRAGGPPSEVLTEPHLRAAFDTTPVVGRNPTTGTVSVTALPDAGERDARVHVVGGGGAATGLLHSLVAAGFSVSVGPLQEGDPDLETAALLDLDVASGPAFAPLDGAPVERALNFAGRADAVVLAPVPVGPANEAALDVAAAADRAVVVDDGPFGERNEAGDGARRRYEALRERAVVADPGEVVDALDGVLAGDHRQAVSGSTRPTSSPPSK